MRVKQANSNRQNPLSLDGRGIKGEGDSKTVPPHRHSRVGGHPQGGCVVPSTVILALRQYPQGTDPVIAGQVQNDGERHMNDELESTRTTLSA